MVDRQTLGWAAVFATVVVLSVPWFLWGNAAVAFGLPVWLWWHIGWMVLTAVVFAVFASRAWGVGIESETDPAGGERA